MPNLRTTKATIRIRTAWAKRERSWFMRSLERHQERDQVHVVLRGQGLTEHGRHHTLGESGHGAGAGRIEDLPHQVVRRLDLRDLREIGTDRRRADLSGLVAGDAAALAGEDRLARLRVAGPLQLGRLPATRRARAHGLRDVVT